MILQSIARLISLLIEIYIFIIIIRSIISWVGNVPPNEFIFLLRRLTDPVFRFVHKHVPFTIVGGIDISPIIIIIALSFLDGIIYRLLVGPGRGVLY